MKKMVCFFVVIFLLVRLVSGEITGEAITGEAITGDATQTVGMNITITGGIPSLVILSPLNRTYTSNESLLLNYSVSGEEAVWYSLDGGDNFTITSHIYFNVSKGGHILYLYANNTQGVSTKSVSFSVNLSAEESEVVEEDVEVPSSGGGSSVLTDFSVNQEQIKISLKQGETKKHELIIKNTGSSAINFELSSDFLDFVHLTEEKFTLSKGDSKKIIIDFLAREETVPNLYFGKIFVRGGGKIKEVPFSVEVESKKALFDVEVEIPRKYREVVAGEEVLMSLEIFNLGELKKVDVVVEYFLKDGEGNTILSESEAVAVETRAGMIKTFQIPENMKSGDYVIYVRVSYDGEVSSSTAWFMVIEEISLARKSVVPLVIYFLISMILIVLAIIVFYKIKERTKVIRGVY